MPLGDLSRDGQGQHDQGGWSQARYARRRDREAVDHLRRVADAIGDSIDPGSETLLVVACVEEQRPIFEGASRGSCSGGAARLASIEAHADADALQPVAERLLEERLEAERQTLLERLARGGPAGRAAASWEDAISAASDGRIEVVLIDGRTRDAWECPVCGRGSAAPVCDLDGTLLEATPGDALELVVRGTLRNGGQVRLATPESDAGEPRGHRWRRVSLFRYAVASPE